MILVIAVLAAVVVILLILMSGQKNQQEQQDGSGSTGVSGVIAEGWDSGIDNGGVEYSEVQIPGYKDAKMKEGDKILHLSIGNPDVNNVDLYASVELEDGTVLYESDLLEPGYGIKDIPLAETLKKGTYKAYVVYRIVSADEAHTPMNTARSEFILYVE